MIENLCISHTILHTVSQVVEAFKNVSKYTYLVAQKTIQTTGVSNKSYGRSEGGNSFFKEELLYFIYTGGAPLPATRWQTLRRAACASALEISLFPHSHLVVLRRLAEHATPGPWRLSARLASDKVTINSPTCKKII